MAVKRRPKKGRGVGKVMGRTLPVWGFPTVIGWSHRSWEHADNSERAALGE